MKKTDEKLKLLHVDDDEIFLKFFQKAFKNYFEIVSVLNGIEALEKLKDSSYDVVVVDYNMPGMNGLELLKMIRKNFDHIPLLFYTETDSPRIIRQAFLSETSDYLKKEFFDKTHKQEILESINYVIKKKGIDKKIHDLMRLERGIGKMAQVLLETHKLGPCIKKSLRQVLNATDAQLCYYIEEPSQNQLFNPFGNTESLVFEESKYLDIFKATRDNLPGLEIFHRWFDQLNSRKTVHGSIDLFPLEEKNILQNYGMKSILLLPVSIDSARGGVFGIEHYKTSYLWDKDSLRVAKKVAEILNSYITISEKCFLRQ